MSRRRLLQIGTAACLLVATPFVVSWALTPAPGVTLENFKRLHQGMKLEQMEAILGRPPDHIGIQVNGPPTHLWEGDEGTVSITHDFMTFIGEFQNQGETVCKLAPAPQSLLAHIRRLFGP